MKIGTARTTLAALWLVGGVLFLVILIWKTPSFESDKQKVWEQAPTLVAPMLSLVMTFFFGVPGSKKDSKLESAASFFAALFISAVHLLVLFLVTFLWEKPIIENLQSANLFVGYFSTVLTIPALNFFFLRAVKQDP